MGLGYNHYRCKGCSKTFWSMWCSVTDTYWDGKFECASCGATEYENAPLPKCANCGVEMQGPSTDGDDVCGVCANGYHQTGAPWTYKETLTAGEKIHRERETQDDDRK